MKRPPQFEVNIHTGALTRDQLTTWARQMMMVHDLVVCEALYNHYLANWRDAAKPLMLEECRGALDNGCSLEEITQVLSTPVYMPMKADILMELRFHQQARNTTVDGQ